MERTHADVIHSHGTELPILKMQGDDTGIERVAIDIGIDSDTFYESATRGAPLVAHDDRHPIAAELLHLDELTDDETAELGITVIIDVSATAGKTRYVITKLGSHQERDESSCRIRHVLTQELDQVSEIGYLMIVELDIMARIPGEVTAYLGQTLETAVEIIQDSCYMTVGD